MVGIFPDDIIKCSFFNENVWISNRISLKFVSEVPINNVPALVQIMAWRRPGDKLLSEPMMVSLLRHICVTRPHWIKWSSFYWHQSIHIVWPMVCFSSKQKASTPRTVDTCEANPVVSLHTVWWCGPRGVYSSWNKPSSFSTTGNSCFHTTNNCTLVIPFNS